MKEDDLNKNFQTHIDSLCSFYENASLKEKHKLNEHIKHILDTHKEADNDFLEDELELKQLDLSPNLDPKNK